MGDNRYMMLGDYINIGGHRVVFRHKTNPDWVVKVARDNTYYNIAEFQAWQIACKKGLQDWLIPCVKLLEGGKYLIQEIGESITKEDIPKNIPECINLDADNERQWKRHNGKIKKCDYDHNERERLQNY
jgi:hypothetical protein